MPLEAASQWEFQELAFAQAPVRVVLTVAGLTGKIRKLLEGDIGNVWVTGEVTNCRMQSSGHAYFAIKDETAQLSCVLFRSEPVEHRNLLKDGTRVTLGGEITVYEARGQYQLRVTAIELEGVGALQAAFEKLKARLNAEGLFAVERKRPIPKYPRRIGLVTSPTGAAIRDVLHVIERRNPALEIVLASCAVQGKSAGYEISTSIRLLNEWSSKSEPANKLDLILITRGGGSLEDLWAFNEEIVARAIHGSELPVVSAVGHEIDFTISDFVADFRAATPSAAAELITEGVFSSCKFLTQAALRLRQLALQEIDNQRRQFAGFHGRLEKAHPRRRLQERMQKLDDLNESLTRCLRVSLKDKTRSHVELQSRLLRFKPRQLISERHDAFRAAKRRLDQLAKRALALETDRLNRAMAKLQLLSAEHTLARGYSITTDAETGKVITAAGQAPLGTAIKTRLKTGELISVVRSSGAEPPK